MSRKIFDHYSKPFVFYCSENQKKYFTNHQMQLSFWKKKIKKNSCAILFFKSNDSSVKYFTSCPNLHSLPHFLIKFDLKIPALFNTCNAIFSFFSILVFCQSTFTNYRITREGEANTNTNFSLPLHEHLDTCRVIKTLSSPLCIVSDRNSTGNLRFLSASR